MGSLEANIDPSLTKLDKDVHAPWGPMFELGQGFDAVKGYSKASPFKGIRSLKVVPDPDPPTFIGDLKVVHGQHEISKIRRFRGEGAINTHSPVTLEATFASERASRDSNASFMIEQYAYGEYHFETLNMDELQLTDEAQSLLQRSPREFQDQYGDYFIVGYRRRFTFSALVECYTSNKEYTKQTEYDAKVALQNVLGAGVGYTKNIDHSDFKINLVARISQSGCDIPIPQASVDIKDVIEAIGKMKEARPEGRREIAQLRPYCRLYHDRSLLDSVPVSPRIFDKLHELDSMAWELEYSQFHPAHDLHTVEMIKRVLKTFTEGRSSFISDGASLENSRNALSHLKKLLDDQLRLYNLIQAQRDSPPYGSKVKSSDPDPKWEYGLVTVLTLPTTAKPREYNSVTLDDGISAYEAYEAYEALIETEPPSTTWASRFFGAEFTTRTSEILRFSSIRSFHTPLYMPETANLFSVTVSHMETSIVGWTLSCRTTGKPNTKTKTFMVQSGGVNCGNLTICVTPVKGYMWRCRIYFVDKNKYGRG